MSFREFFIGAKQLMSSTESWFDDGFDNGIIGDEILKLVDKGENNDDNGSIVTSSFAFVGRVKSSIGPDKGLSINTESLLVSNTFK